MALALTSSECSQSNILPKNPSNFLFPKHPPLHLCKSSPIPYIQTAAAYVNCLVVVSRCKQDRGETEAVDTMILIVMQLVTDDGNYSYACKVDLEKIDLRDGKWAGELLPDCPLKVEKGFLY